MILAAALVLLLPQAPAPASAAADGLLDAVRKGDVAAVKAALDAGVPVDHPFRYERTALSFATARGNLDVVRLLLDRGADPNKKDSFYGATPLSWAIQEGRTDVVRLLLDRGAPAGPELLQNAAREGNLELLALALEKTKPSTDDLAMALADAKQEKHDAAVEVLVKAGAAPPSPPNFPIDAATLAGYAGAYREDRGGELRFEVRDGRLVCANCRPQGLVLGAVDAVTFREAERPRPKLVFTLAEGRPSALTIDFGDRQTSYRRVPDEPAKEKP